jgi:hypothetical protein
MQRKIAPLSNALPRDDRMSIKLTTEFRFYRPFATPQLRLGIDGMEGTKRLTHPNSFKQPEAI